MGLNVPNVCFVNPLRAASSLGQVGLAVLAGLWSYDGWNSVNYVTEELVDPQRTLPRSVLLGLPLVTLWYGGQCFPTLFTTMLPPLIIFLSLAI